MGDRAYLSIGEVLSLLKDEFPDVTISKIRFLESQGLLDPERTASGYRKFYEPDVDRLRWILRQQREHFLPLKVIKGRLGVSTGDDDGADDGRPAPAAGRDSPATAVVDAPPVAPPGPGPVTAAAPPPAARAAAQPASPTPVAAQPASPTPVGAPPASPAQAAGHAPTAPVAEVAMAASPAVAPGPAQAAATPPAGEPSPPPSPPTRPPPAAAHATSLSAGMTGVSLSLEELASATGLPYDRLRELERYGFIAGRPVAGTVYYDEEALVVANLAVGFASFGIEGRHLRIYKNSAEREAGLFEQIVTPLLKQRNPEARRQAVESLEELTRLGQSLRAAVLRQSLRRLSGG